MTALFVELDWHARAACKGIDPDLFYPERGEPTDKAKAVCGVCRVRQECLEFALANREKHGIWGGTSEQERRKLRRERMQHGKVETPAADRSDMLNALRAGQWTVQQLSRRVGLSDSVTLRALKQLEEQGLACRAGTTTAGGHRVSLWTHGGGRET